MAAFDVRHPRWVMPEFALAYVQDGWIGQKSGTGFISTTIMRSTQSVHSHSTMFRRNDDEDTVDILEVTEWVGGRGRPASYYFKQPGRWDIFSANAGNRWPEFSPAGATRLMRLMTEYDYGWRGILHAAVRRTPLLWHFARVVTIEGDAEAAAAIKRGDLGALPQPFCSHAVALATHLGGGVRPLANIPYNQVTPGMLTISPFYDYEFSVVTPWAIKKYGIDITSQASINQREYLAARPK